MNQNLSPEQTIRPEDLMNEFNIKKDTYYDDVKFLDIDVQKDSENKPYLTFEQAEQIRALRSHVKNTGKREGFINSSIVKVDDNNLAELNNTNDEENIYVKPQDPVEQINVNKIIRKASELKAKEIVTPELLIRELANRMEEEDLPDDLKEKISAVREAANPKWTPAGLAENLLSQYRSSRSGN
jgi:hypothetical protein